MYLGVDFGTSFSQSATMHNGFPHVLLGMGEYGIPSEFYYDSENGIQIGEDALDLSGGINAKNLVSEAKMKLNSPPIRLDGRDFSYEEIVRNIYRVILTRAQNIAATKLIKNDIEGVVLTVPVSFGYQEKSMIRDAAQGCLGGTIKVLDVIKEPVAAAISYYKDSLADDKTVLVFDLGGGTCDVALVRSNSGTRERFEVIDSDMERIGGRDWDKELIKYIAREVQKKSGVDILSDDSYQRDLKSEAVKVKMKLSDGISMSASARIALKSGRLISVPIQLGLFEELTMGLLDKALGCLQRVYDRNSATYNIDEIICVGGSSNMRQVKAGIVKRFWDVTVHLYEPEHAVVNGAAIYADLIKDLDSTLVLSDISSFSYGIKAGKVNDSGEYIFNLIQKGDKLPKTGNNSFSPASDNQSLVSFKIYESEIAEYECDINIQKTFIGEVIFRLPPNTTTSFSIQCDMTLKGDGFLYFNAVDQNGQTVPATFELRKMNP